jgi:hypothetical protein
VGSYTISKPLALLFLFCGITLTVTNVMMAHRLSKVRQFGDLLNSSNKLGAGTKVPRLVGYDLDGKKITYDYSVDSRDTLLLILSPGCHACDENWPNWTRLINSLDPKTVRLIIANVTPIFPMTKEYATQHGIAAIPLIAEITAESARAYHLGYTPETVLIGSSGEVKKVETGFLTNAAFLPASDIAEPIGTLAKQN